MFNQLLNLIMLKNRKKINKMNILKKLKNFQSQKNDFFLN